MKSFVEASALDQLVATEIHNGTGPVLGCVAVGTWALVRYRGPHSIGTLFAVKEDGAWKHVAHGPRVITIKDLHAISQIGDADAKALVKAEATLPH